MVNALKGLGLATGNTATASQASIKMAELGISNISINF